MLCKVKRGLELIELTCLRVHLINARQHKLSLIQTAGTFLYRGLNTLKLLGRCACGSQRLAKFFFCRSYLLRGPAVQQLQMSRG